MMKRHDLTKIFWRRFFSNDLWGKNCHQHQRPYRCSDDQPFYLTSLTLTWVWGVGVLYLHGEEKSFVLRAEHMLNCKINGTVHIFFLKKSYLSPRWTKLPQFFFYGSFPIILSCYKWVLSRLGPLHGQNWRNVSKKCLFGCPKPKSLKMTNLYPNCSGTLEQKIILFGFFHQYRGTKYWWKNPTYMIFCSRVPEQLG